MLWKPLKFQEKGVKFILERGGAALLLNPGRGKTAIVLAAHLLLLEAGQIQRTLVVCPKNPMFGVWPIEAKKWEDFQEIGVEVLHGPDKEKRLHRLAPEKSVYVVNFDGLEWFTKAVATMDEFPFDMLVVDESSYVKDTRTKRFKYLQSMLNLFKRRYILTGDPAPNNLLDLFGPFYIVDGGAALGRFITHYRNEYFMPSGYGGYTYLPQPDAEARIRKRLAPLAYTLTEADQKGLPPITYNVIEFDLDRDTMRDYARFKRTLVHDLGGEEAITAVNHGVLTNKLQQFTGGAVYDEGGRVVRIHDDKMMVLRDLLDQREGRPTIVVYNFEHERERIDTMLPGRTKSFSSCKNEKQVQALLEEWNRGEIPILLAHQKSMSHGLNMQGVEAHIVWFYITASNESYRQLVRRVYRTGQKYPVVVHHLVARSTWDDRGMDLLQSKDANQQRFLEALKKELTT